ncbi:hypothetical protein BGY98DRAFT_940051 [Russula aff. rugulosa BPL654]|nr:hypothetical protein BGY98DRAFT_940051 [Russula aff. rugulosa BPL654]
MPSSRRSKEVGDDDNSIGGRICTYQQAHIIEKGDSLWRGYQSVKKYILYVETRATWPRGRLASRGQPGDHAIHQASNATIPRPPGTQNPVRALVDDQICVFRGKSSTIISSVTRSGVTVPSMLTRCRLESDEQGALAVLRTAYLPGACAGQHEMHTRHCGEEKARTHVGVESGLEEEGDGRAESAHEASFWRGMGMVVYEEVGADAAVFSGFSSVKLARLSSTSLGLDNYDLAWVFTALRRPHDHQLETQTLPVTPFPRSFRSERKT